ncbi:TRAP transporter small permease [uncultured Albimonas sp.]|uniref:TRAP transporter small permease n=1 Tax=uncultured Albimonas sp. TaxID=1331701 RepID=UPI0030EBD47C|tara:strand:- start:858 stop:1451 length:594 start_codon:yes stop_codon:yes gene_type:complete
MTPPSAERRAPSRAVAAYLRARAGLGRIETGLAWISAACIIAAGVYITLGIVLRAVFNSGVVDELVIVGELMVAAIVLPLALVCAQRGFIAVEVVSGLFGARGQKSLDLLSDLVGLFAVVPLLAAGGLALSHVVADGSFHFGMLDLPKWPGYAAFVIGYLMFLIRLVDLLVLDLLRALGRFSDASGEFRLEAGEPDL